MHKPTKEPCKKYACAIQDCLRQNNYQESKCLEAIEAMKKCCRGLTTYSFICEGMLEKNDEPPKPKKVASK